MPLAGIVPEPWTMEYVLLSPDEAGTLLDRSADAVVALVESGELGGLRVAGQWRVPLVSVARMLAGGGKDREGGALERVLCNPETWARVFGAHPEVTQSVEAGDFPPGSVGAGLKAAIAHAREPEARPGLAGRSEDEQDAGDRA